jgi:hypothetical protein
MTRQEEALKGGAWSHPPPPSGLFGFCSALPKVITPGFAPPYSGLEAPKLAVPPEFHPPFAMWAWPTGSKLRVWTGTPLVWLFPYCCCVLGGEPRCASGDDKDGAARDAKETGLRTVALRRTSCSTNRG